MTILYVGMMLRLQKNFPQKELCTQLVVYIVESTRKRLTTKQCNGCASHAHLTILVVADSAYKILEILVQNSLQRTFDFIQRERHAGRGRLLLNRRINHDIFAEICSDLSAPRKTNNQYGDLLTCGVAVCKMRLRRKPEVVRNRLHIFNFATKWATLQNR